MVVAVVTVDGSAKTQFPQDDFFYQIQFICTIATKDEISFLPVVVVITAVVVVVVVVMMIPVVVV